VTELRAAGRRSLEPCRTYRHPGGHSTGGGGSNKATTADEVSGNIQQVDQAAGRLLDGARAVNQAADTLSKGSRALSDNTARFRLS